MRIAFPSGPDRIGGELAVPERSGPHPGVVLIPDVGGLSPLYSSFAARLAGSGFVTLALDLYSRGERPDLSSVDAIFKFLRDLPDRQVLGDIQAAIDHLRSLPELAGRGIGITGFCAGGKYAILAACTCRGLGVAVPWYGMLRADVIDERNPEHPLDALPRLSCPLLALCGEEDPYVPLADVDELRRRGARAPHEVEVMVYAGAGHAFANSGRAEAYRPQAAEDAWGRALEFLHQHLDPALESHP